MGRPELLPCPFCGSTNLSNRLGSVECLECLSDGPFSREPGTLDRASQDADAAAYWNRRTPAAPPEPTSALAKVYCDTHGPFGAVCPSCAAATPGTAPTPPKGTP